MALSDCFDEIFNGPYPRINSNALGFRVRCMSGTNETRRFYGGSKQLAPFLKARNYFARRRAPTAYPVTQQCPICRAQFATFLNQFAVIKPICDSAVLGAQIR